MSEESRIQKLLTTLEERMRKGEISRNNYEHLKNKYENKIAEMRPGIGSSVTYPGEYTTDSVVKQAVEKEAITSIMESFSLDLQEMLIFEEAGDCILIKTRKFLGSANFAKIRSIVRSLGGEYINAGKDSHFRVPK